MMNRSLATFWSHVEGQNTNKGELFKKKPSTKGGIEINLLSGPNRECECDNSYIRIFIPVITPYIPDIIPCIPVITHYIPFINAYFPLCKKTSSTVMKSPPAAMATFSKAWRAILRTSIVEGFLDIFGTSYIWKRNLNLVLILEFWSLVETDF